jgi:hypothetical protein
MMVATMHVWWLGVMQVLKLLRESTGNILDDEILINTLNNSKVDEV